MATLITVTLYIDGDDSDAIDWANETLRGMQRDFTPGSDLIDYTIDRLVEVTDPTDAYEEGDMTELDPDNVLGRSNG